MAIRKVALVKLSERYWDSSLYQILQEIRDRVNQVIDVVNVETDASITAVEESIPAMPWVSVLDYGAKGDLQTVIDGVMNTGSPALTSASALFRASDVGKIVTVRGAGAVGAGLVLVSKIIAYVSATQVTLLNNSAANVTNAAVNWGTDDTTAIQNALDGLPAGGGVVYAPGGKYGYMITAQLKVGNGTNLYSPPGPPYDSISTINGIAFVGDNIGGLDWANGMYSATGGLARGGSRICWGSSTATVPMVYVAGPIDGVRIENFTLDANGIATGGLDIHRSFNSYYHRIATVHWQDGYAHQLRANAGIYIEGGGAPANNVFEQVGSYRPYGTAANGFQLGAGSGNCNQNAFIRCYWQRGNDNYAVGVDIQNADHNEFFACISTRPDGATTGIGLQFTTQGGITPSAIYFYGCSWLGGISENGTPVNNRTISWHFPWDREDSEPQPPTGANGTTLGRVTAVGVFSNPLYQDEGFMGPFRFANQLAVQNALLTLSNGLNSNITITDYSMFTVQGPSAVFSVGGFVVTTPGSRILYLHNNVAFAMTIVNEDASSTAANRITTLTGANVVLRAGVSFATFIYSTSNSRWILTSYN